MWRWFFAPLGILSTFLLILCQLVYLPFYLYKYRKTFGERITPPAPINTLDDIIEMGKDDPINPYGLVREESHTLLLQAGNGLLNPQNKEKLLSQVIKPSGTLFRQYPADEYWLGPSGDGISSWVFFYILTETKRPDLVEKLAKHYLKGCLGLYWEHQRGYTNRASNSGFNIVVDAWPRRSKYWPFYWGFSTPVFGPGFLTSQALLELAGKELGLKWKVIAKLHWLLFGGMFYSIIPYMPFGKELYYYAAHISSLNLWSLNKLTGLYKWPMRWVAKIAAPKGNIQPFIGAVAADVGVLSQDEIDEGIANLRAIKKARFWPQVPIVDETFYKGESTNYSMMAFAAILFKRSKGGKWWKF